MRFIYSRYLSVSRGFTYLSEVDYVEPLLAAWKSVSAFGFGNRLGLAMCRILYPPFMLLKQNSYDCCNQCTAWFKVV